MLGEDKQQNQFMWSLNPRKEGLRFYLCEEAGFQTMKRRFLTVSELSFTINGTKLPVSLSILVHSGVQV